MMFLAALPPDVRKWLCPSEQDALLFWGYAPPHRDQAVWRNFDNILQRQTRGA
jgi:hypothetical protein